MRLKKTCLDRFWEKVSITDGCWLWESAIGHNGYGVFWIGRGASQYAHRLSFELHAAVRVPLAREVMHSCDNPRCVNPSHLSIGTSLENSADCVRKGRSARGERNGGGGKLTEASALQILALHRVEPRKAVAARFNVHEGTVKKIWGRAIWRHISLQEAA